MIVSVRHKFVFISMPKCASTSTEAVLGRRCDIKISGNPKLKHTSFSEYQKHILPFLRDKLGDQAEELEVVSLFRHPIAWLNSWYRFRLRERGEGKPRRRGARTAGLTFDDFLERYANDKEGPVNVGRQVDRILDMDGRLGKVTLFQYERYDDFLRFISRKLGKEITSRRLNVSPEQPADISAYQHFVEHSKIAADWAIYQSIAGPPQG